MRATLQDCASNTYFGQWPRVFPGEWAQNEGFIAHNGLAARARFGRSTRASVIPPGNRAPADRKFTFRPKRKIGRVSRLERGDLRQKHTAVPTRAGVTPRQSGRRMDFMSSRSRFLRRREMKNVGPLGFQSILPACPPHPHTVLAYHRVFLMLSRVKSSHWRSTGGSQPPPTSMSSHSTIIPASRTIVS